MKKVAKIVTILLALCIAMCIFVACDKGKGDNVSPEGKTYKFDKIEATADYDWEGWEEELEDCKERSDLFANVTDLDGFKSAYNQYLNDWYQKYYSITLKFEKDGTCVLTEQNLNPGYEDTEEYTLNWEKDGDTCKITSEDLVSEEDGIYFEFKGNTIIWHTDEGLDYYLKA